jgi:hypothetical protein
VRWSKHPAAMAPVGLEKPERIAAWAMLTVLGLLVYRVIQRQVRLSRCTHDQQLPGNKGRTAIPTAAVVLALFAHVALIQCEGEEPQSVQLYGVQPHHLLICEALGLDHAWYAVPSAHKIDQFSQSPWTWVIRQVAVDGMGHPQPTLFVSNTFDASARDLITRDTGRNGVEDSLGISVNFFHLNCLASEVRLNVDVDMALTVLAHGCYRWLATQLHGFDKAKPKQLDRKFVETGGQLEIQADRIVVRFDKRAHNPILREAALEKACPRIPWLHHLPVMFAYP